MPNRYKDRLRPVYHAVLNALHPEGKLVTINGTDAIRLSAEQYSPGQQEPDVGLCTLGFAQRLRGRGRVFSFEPDSQSYRLLQRHIALNNFSEIVCAINIAVSDASGVLRFVGGMGPFSHAAAPEEAAASCVSIASFRLDGIFDPPGIVPDVVKIDVEGFELQVLRGAVRILSRPERPRLPCLELHPWAWSRLGLDTSYKAVHDLQHDLGYQVQKRNEESADIFAAPYGTQTPSSSTKP